MDRGNGAGIAIGAVAALAALGMARGRRGSSALAQQQDNEDLDVRVYRRLMRAGGVPVDGGRLGVQGPAPLGHVILTEVYDDDGDPGVWINWVEGVRGSSGAWKMVEAAVEAEGGTFAAGETIFSEVLEGWERRGFTEIDEESAADIYEGASADDETRFFLKYL